MKMLALEFSSERRSVAVAEAIGDEVRLLAEVADGVDGRGALEMVKAALQQAQVQRGEIECIAVGLGPGSYTGIRMAIALAQGWQLARGVKLMGASSAEAIAWQARAEGVRGRVRVAIDAQRGDYYVAEYEVVDLTVSEADALRIVPISALSPDAHKDVLLALPEKAGTLSGARAVFPTALGIAALAMKHGGQVGGGLLEPIYLRATTFTKVVASPALPI